MLTGPSGRILFTLTSALLLFIIVTGVALEGRDVVVLRTFDSAGSAEEVRIWIADEEGFSWIEAATEERSFLVRIRRQPRVEIVRDGAARSFHAAPIGNPGGHEKIRRLLAKKYGWADSWIGLLTDTDGSVGIRLVPTGPTG